MSEEQFVTNTNDKAEEAKTSARRNQYRLTNRKGLFTALISNTDQLPYYEVTMRNDNGTPGEVYKGVLDAAGTIYELNQVVQVYFSAVSPIPKIIGAVGGGGSIDGLPGNFYPVIGNRLGFLGDF
jgi:hypothetical protein